MTSSATPPADLAGRTVTVMGLGRFGGGIGVTRWLCAQGATVRITDLTDAERLAEPLTPLRGLIASSQVTLRLGEHRHEDFTETDLVVANPAVPHPWDNPYLRAAAEAGVAVTTEIRLATERIDRVQAIGVTGTAGKSTTSAMITHILRRRGRPAHWGGNIGGSLLDHLPTIGRDDPVVLELSSFMLHWLGRGIGWPTAPHWSPATALLTNLMPNHLDWHRDLEHYTASKRNIFGDPARPDPADLHLRGDMLPERVKQLVLPDGIPAIPGGHNRQNARMALAVASAWLDEPVDSLVDALRSFRGLPHRLETVLERDGVRFINDSKSTTPESTLQAIAALTESLPADRIHLIAGGYDKGTDLASLAELAPTLAGLYAIGTTAPRLIGHHRAERADTLGTAVQIALTRLRDGDVLLLSPGCASWDQFDNYEERGETFRRLVVSLSNPAGSRSASA